MFSGFKSLWTIFLEWMYSKLRKIWRMIVLHSSSVNHLFLSRFLIIYLRDPIKNNNKFIKPPLTSSIDIRILVSVSSTSLNLTIFSWFSEARIEDSYLNKVDSLCSIVFFNILTAHSSFFFNDLALTTVPNAPFPITSRN